MGSAYEIVRHDLGDGAMVDVLAARGDAGSDFLEKMYSRDHARFRLIVRTVKRISLSDADTYRGTFLKTIDDNLSLVEVKVPGKVIRIMAYDRRDGTHTRLVLLFDFDGHQGKTGKIKPSLVKKGKTLAKIARECAEGDS